MRHILYYENYYAAMAKLAMANGTWKMECVK
jgi:hypothetical protein